ncbi:hypothetical protein BGW80DRAFT_1463403 [Lactifluus volemus]|nr:hypothetical protein BGW80DRAFT_1463403 [Lactifluus volemus]
MCIIEPDGTDVDEHHIDFLSVTVAQRYSVLVTARNDAGCNWAIHANRDTAMFDHIPDTLQPSEATDLLSTLASPCQPPLPLAAAAVSVTCDLGGVFNILLLMGANLVGFVLGVDGAQYFVHEMTGCWDGNPRNSIRANDGVAKMGTLWWPGSRCHCKISPSLQGIPSLTSFLQSLLVLHQTLQPQLVLLQCRFQLVEFRLGVSSGGCARLLFCGEVRARVDEE